MKKILTVLLALMVFSGIALAEEIAIDDLPEYYFVFHNGVEFGMWPSNVQLLAKQKNFKTEWIEAQKPENEPYAGRFGCIIYDAIVAGIENVRVEYRAQIISRTGCISQCAYHCVGNPTAYDSLSAALTEKYQNPGHTEQDGGSYSVVKECYETVTSGLADAEINGKNICARYSQWLVRACSGAIVGGPVLIDLSEMVDSNGTVVDCVLRYTLLPKETSEVDTATNSGI